MPKLLSGAEIVFKSLEDQKVEYIFGYPGGAVLPIYDELKNHKIEMIFGTHAIFQKKIIFSKVNGNVDLYPKHTIAKESPTKTKSTLASSAIEADIESHAVNAIIFL